MIPSLDISANPFQQFKVYIQEEKKVIYISTFSKSIFPSCRVAYMVLPYSIMKKYHSQNHIEGNTVPVHMQNLIATFISSGGFEKAFK